eukprot:scpid71420/ scgid29069/ 
MVCDSIAFLVFTLITAAIATSETNPTVSWTDCGAPHGKIKMTAFLEEQRHAEARKHCQNLNGDLATVQSTLERNCANAALNNVRTCTCCNSRGYYQCARVSGTGSCGCAAWVGLTGTNFSNGKFKSWTWYTPSSNTRSSSIAWIRSFPRQKRARYRVFYHPELGGFFNVHDSPRPYLCQQYYPPAPSNLTVTSTDTEISVSVEDTYSSAISKYCFILNATKSLCKNTICDAMQNVKFTGLASNMLYNVSAYVVTTDGRNSTGSKTMSISTSTNAKTTSDSQDSPISATAVTKDPNENPIHTAVQAITNQSDSNIDTESGSQDNTSSFGLAAIVASSGAAGLLVLVIAIILIWKFKMGPRKQGGDLNLRDQSVSNHNPLDPVQDTPISMDANEAYGTCVLAKNDAYGCVELRGNEEHGNGSGAGGGLESVSEAEDNYYTYIDLQ